MIAVIAILLTKLDIDKLDDHKNRRNTTQAPKAQQNESEQQQQH